MSKRIRFSAGDDRIIRDLYPHRSTKEVAARLGRKLDAVYRRAHYLGLHKTAEYLASPAACRLRQSKGADRPGFAWQFPKGHVPANKGQRRPGWSTGRMAETQFRKGETPHTWMPIGSTRLVSGYVYRKVSDVRNVPWTRNWTADHIRMWEEVNGRLNRSTHALKFKDGDRSHISLDNLELITRGENMRRNTIHRLPAELKQVIQLTGALGRKIRNRERAKESTARSA